MFVHKPNIHTGGGTTATGATQRGPLSVRRNGSDATTTLPRAGGSFGCECDFCFARNAHGIEQHTNTPDTHTQNCSSSNYTARQLNGARVAVDAAHSNEKYFNLMHRSCDIIVRGSWTAPGDDSACDFVARGWEEIAADCLLVGERSGIGVIR